MKETTLNIAFYIHNLIGGGVEVVTSSFAHYISEHLPQKLGYKQVKCYILTNTSLEKQVFHIDNHLRELIKIQNLSVPIELLWQEHQKVQDEIRQFILDNSVQVFFTTQNGLLCPLNLPKSIKQYYWLHNEPFYEATEIEEHLHKYPSLRNRIKLWLKPLLKKKWMQYTIAEYRERVNAWDGIIVLCPEYKQLIVDTLKLNEAQQSKLISVSNTIDLDNNYDTRKEKIIVWVGRFEAQKRIDRMLAIWQKVNQVLPDWTLRIYGNGSQLDMCQETIKRHALPRIQLCGHELNKTKIYSQASILCMTSEYEGWPIVLMEAQRYACVPIMFNSFRAAPVIIGQKQEAGILVPPFNLKVFCQQLIALCRDRERRENLQKACVSKSQAYSPSINEQVWLRLLDTADNNGDT